MKKVKLIYNPFSGETVMQASLDRVVSLYQQKGFQIVPYRLMFDPGSEQGILFDLDDSYDHIVIAGGDGTVNFVLNVLKNNNIDIPVGIIPVGTANDFALNIGMSASIEKSCRRILSGEVRDADLGMVNGHYFVNVLGVGLFSDLSLRTPTIIKNYFGKLAYYVGGIGELAKLRKINIDLRSDGGDFNGECYLMLIFNGRTAGSIRIAHTADIGDGLLDILIVKVGTLETMRTISHFLSPARSKRNGGYPAGMVHIQCSRLTVTSGGNERVDIDGETGPGFPLDIACEKGAFRLIIPRKGDAAVKGRGTITKKKNNDTDND